MTDIDNIAFAIVNRKQFVRTVGTVITAGIARHHFIGECFLTDLARILVITIIQVQIIVVCAAPRAVSLKRKDFPMLYGSDTVSSDDVFRTKLFRFSHMENGLFIHGKVSVRDHRIPGSLLLADCFVNCLEMRFEVLVKLPDSEHTGIDEFIELRVIDDLRNLIRNIFQQKQRFHIGTE